MITKEMIRKGYEKKVIELVMSPHGDGVVCQIGSYWYWFYFGGLPAEEAESVQTYRDSVDLDTILSEIYQVLEEMGDDPMDCEYSYYEAVLAEQGDSAIRGSKD